jgi:hypothetical protein
MSDEKPPVVPVRVGDRYTVGDHHVTITAVRADPYMIEYTRMDPRTKVSWSSRTQRIPRPWVKTGSGARVILTCVACGQDDAEPGLIYCGECIDRHAEAWSGIPQGDAKQMAQRLITEAEEERANRE